MIAAVLTSGQKNFFSRFILPSPLLPAPHSPSSEVFSQSFLMPFSPFPRVRTVVACPRAVLVFEETSISVPSG
ncbi:hypothetical protein GCM10023069_30770 [Shinella granuli]